MTIAIERRESTPASIQAKLRPHSPSGNKQTQKNSWTKDGETAINKIKNKKDDVKCFKRGVLSESMDRAKAAGPCTAQPCLSSC